MRFWAVLALGTVLHPGIEVRDVDGVARHPFSVAGRAEALFFITQDCPISNYYSHEIRRICDQYSTRGVGCALVYVDPSIGDADAKRHAEEYGHGVYPKIVDRKHVLVAATGATITPEVVVIGPHGAIEYRGRIDNSYAGLGRPRRVVTEHDLRDTLDAILDGKPVAKRQTQPIGCYIPDLKALSQQ